MKCLILICRLRENITKWYRSVRITDSNSWKWFRDMHNWVFTFGISYRHPANIKNKFKPQISERVCEFLHLEMTNNNRGDTKELLNDLLSSVMKYSWKQICGLNIKLPTPVGLANWQIGNLAELPIFCNFTIEHIINNLRNYLVIISILYMD